MQNIRKKRPSVIALRHAKKYCSPSQYLKDRRHDASPDAILRLKDKAERDSNLCKTIMAATTSPPLRPALTRALVDAWSMTSLEEHTGRPDVEPWLRGWVENVPQATIVWRRYLPARMAGAKLTKKEMNYFFEEAPPQTSEGLEAEIWRVVDWLIARAVQVTKQSAGIDAPATLSGTSTVLFVLNREYALEDDPRDLGQLAELANKERERERKQFQQSLIGRTLVVSSLLGGLNSDGMLDKNCNHEPSTIDNDETWEPQRPFRVRDTTKLARAAEADWRESYRVAIKQTGDDETRWVVVEQRQNQAQSEEDRAIAHLEQRLTDHQSAAEQIARRFAEVLKLPPAYSDMLAIAARLHDEGKRASRWQRAFNAPAGDVYAKTKGPVKFNLLDGYRHEFGSLLYVNGDDHFRALQADLRDLVLHLVAAHHGGARPLISTRSCEDAPPTALDARAREVTLRFGRLQKRWGPWGLAWWETLLRAIDQQASRENDAAQGKEKLQVVEGG
jgi:CRISPR-associated endonuclease/helicase Cas3